MIDRRYWLGWDMGLGGGGLILSRGLLKENLNNLEECYDYSLWDDGVGGDWILNRCMNRLGIPLTPSPGTRTLHTHTPYYV